MTDDPTPAQLIAAVAAFVRAEALPALHGATAYQARVAANVLEIAQRELELGPMHHASERQRLRALLGRDGDLATLNRELCEQIAAGRITLETPGLADHLWRTTLAKLAVDQPGYSTYRREVRPEED